MVCGSAISGMDLGKLVRLWEMLIGVYNRQEMRHKIDKSSYLIFGKTNLVS